MYNITRITKKRIEKCITSGIMPLNSIGGSSMQWGAGEVVCCAWQHLFFCGFYGRPISRYICSYSLPCALMSLDRAPWIYCDYCNSLLSCVRALQTDVVVIRDQSTNRERRPALFELDVQSHHATPVRSRDSVLPPHRLPVFRLTSYTLQATRITEMWTQRISTSTILTTTMTAITKQVAVDRPEHILVTAER